MTTSAPSRAAATAWLAPLPPGWTSTDRAEPGLAGLRQAVEREDQVEVDRAEDEDHGAGPRPSTSISSAHSRLESRLPGCSTASPASIRRSTASIAADKVAAPSR